MLILTTLNGGLWSNDGSYRANLGTRLRCNANATAGWVSRRGGGKYIGVLHEHACALLEKMETDTAMPPRYHIIGIRVTKMRIEMFI